MAEITLYRTGELLRKVFEILLPHPEGLPAKTVLEKVEQSVELSDFEESTYPGRPGVRRFEKIIRFSTISPVKAGWLVKNKGQWLLTDEGRRAFEEFTDPEAFSREAKRLYRQWRRDQPEVDEGGEGESLGATTTLEEAEEGAWAEIETHLSQMNPFDFQDLVAGLIRAMGYHVSWISPPGPDKGVDIIAHTDPLGIEGSRIKVQVKRRADRISVEGIRSFMALLGESDAGIFVSIGGFTSDAETEARSQERRRLMLVDSKRLFDLWVEHYAKIPEDQKRLLPLRPIYYLAPLD